MIKESILQEDITILYAYMPNNRTSKYVRQKLMDLQGGRDKPTTIFGDFNTPLSEVHESSRQKNQ